MVAIEISILTWLELELLEDEFGGVAYVFLEGSVLSDAVGKHIRFEGAVKYGN